MAVRIVPLLVLAALGGGMYLAQGREKDKAQRQFLKRGLGDRLTTDDVSPRFLRQGMKVEAEHTSDPRVAQEIVLDHYAEYGEDYYDELGVMEARLRQRRRGVR